MKLFTAAVARFGKPRHLVTDLGAEFIDGVFEPPVRHPHDATKPSVQMVARFGFGGAETIAAHLAKAGLKIAEKAVRSIKREKSASNTPRPRSLNAPHSQVAPR